MLQAAKEEKEDSERAAIAKLYPDISDLTRALKGKKDQERFDIYPDVDGIREEQRIIIIYYFILLFNIL